MLRLLVLVVAITACAVPEIPPDGVSCEQLHQLEQSAPGARVDVVIVVSDAASMAPYRDRVIEQLGQFGEVFAGGGYDIQVTLVTDDGLLTLHDYDLPWWTCGDPARCPQQDYEGAMGDLLAAGVPAADAGTAPPLLERAADALDAVHRRAAWIAVLLIGYDDDASPEPVDAYLERLWPDDAEFFMVSTINGPGAARLAAFRAATDSARTVPIDDADWTQAAWFGVDREDLRGYCLDDQGVIDLDPDAPLIQPDCVATDVDGTVIPPCRMAAPDRPDPDELPCWWVKQDSSGCSAPQVERLIWLEAPRPALRCACEA